MKTIEDIKAAKTSELVAFWNEKNPAKPVKKFSDRATAEKRCATLLEVIEVLEAAPVDPVPAPVVKVKGRKKAAPVEVDTENMTDEEFKAHMLGGVEEKERKSNAAGIAASWADPSVYNARLTRNAVKAEGVEYKSVRAAFAALNLPDSKHIRFRMKLKEAKKAVFEWAGKEYHFEIL